jgi:hypothetical protein
LEAPDFSGAFAFPAAAAKLTGREATMTGHRIYKMAFAAVYPAYVAKAEKKGRTREEVDRIISWQTGYDRDGLTGAINARTDFETFFAEAPEPNPRRFEVKGVICGVRVEEIDEPLMREIRIMDKMIDELAKGRAMEKILRA